MTIADIARDLGISKAAVSYALNGQPGVAADTRQRVAERAAQLGWHASSSARALSGARTGVVGLVLARAAGPADDRDVLHALPRRRREGPHRGQHEPAAARRGDHPDEEIHVYERWWGERRIDGVILVDERYHDPRIAAVERIGLPSVLCGGPVQRRLRCLVSGPTRWATPRSPCSTWSTSVIAASPMSAGPKDFVHERACRRGVRRAAAAHGVEVVTVEASYTGPQAGQVTHQLLSAGSPPTAVIYGSDVMALAGLAVAAECQVPGPARPLGPQLDDSTLTTLVHPSVTALHRDTPAYGALAAGVLLDLVQGRNRGLVQVQPSSLEVRRSTGPAPRH